MSPTGSRAPTAPCRPGLQVYRFYPANEDGIRTDNTDLYLGEDQTTGVSGNCGRNRSLVMNLPVKISKIA